MLDDLWGGTGDECEEILTFSSRGPGTDGAGLWPAEVGPSEPDPLDHLWVTENDRLWDLGPADTDTDADGVNDSLTRAGPEGITVYTDVDADGRVDRITEVDAAGNWRSQTLDPDDGGWVATDRGRLA